MAISLNTHESKIVAIETKIQEFLSKLAELEAK